MKPAIYKPECDPMLEVPIDRCQICQGRPGEGPLEHILEHMVRAGFLKHGQPKDGQVTYMETDAGRKKFETETLPRIRRAMNEDSRRYA